MGCWNSWSSLQTPLKETQKKCIEMTKRPSIEEKFEEFKVKFHFQKVVSLSVYLVIVRVKSYLSGD